MEQLQRMSFPQTASYVRLLKKRPHWVFVFIVVAGFTLANIGVMMISQFTVTPSNPFLEYADVFPGQPMGAEALSVFSCATTNNYYVLGEVSCVFVPVSRIFERVETVIADGIIYQTTFTLRDNIFKNGDLVDLFGKSSFRTFPRKAYFFWRELFVIVSTFATSKHDPLLNSVWSVSFTNTY